MPAETVNSSKGQEMNNSRVRIRLQAQLHSPLHIAGPGRNVALVDRPIELDSRNLPIIPASTARGRIRVHLERLLKTMKQPVCVPPTPEQMCPHRWREGDLAPTDLICMACQLFGNPWHYARVLNDDLLFVGDDITGQTPDLLRMERTSLSVSRILGTAQAERLYTTESTIAQVNGQALRFEGLMTGALSDIELGWLLGSIRLVTHAGGSKARGMGQLQFTATHVDRWDGTQWRAVVDVEKLISEVLL
jgi:CRISPR/Cas system CSM-associated protein Csm3 (group 7 of RAMP superfamily)